MQSADDAELAAHIAGELGERRPAMRFEVDWTGGGTYQDLTECVDSLAVERSLTGDLPAEAGLIDGFSAATCDVDLKGAVEIGGDLWPITTALSPFVAGSLRDGRQLVQARARAWLGMVLDAGPKLLPQWSGPIRELAISASDGKVALSGVDPSDRLRAPITLPTYAEFITHINRRAWKMTVNTQWIVDHVLRRNGIHASPPPRSDAILSCTGHGGLVSEIGFNGAPISLYGSGPTSGLWISDGHPFGMLGTAEAADGSSVGYQEFYGAGNGVDPPVKFQAGYGVGLSCWLHIGNYLALGASFENRLFQIRPTSNDNPRLFVNGFGNGDIYVGLVDETGYVTATPRIATGSGRWRFFGVHFRWTDDTTLAIAVRLDGKTLTYTLTKAKVTEASFYEGYRTVLQVNGLLFRSWSNLQSWVSPTAPPAGAWQGETHTSEADIARGMNELVYLPDIANADSWEILKAAVSAEYGVHSFNEAGRYSFRPRTDTRRSTVDVEFDVLTNLADVRYSTSTDSVRNIVGIETEAAYHAGKLETVVKGDDPYQFTCPVGVTVFDLDWPYGAAGFQGATLPFYKQVDGESGNPTWTGDVINGFAYCYGTNFTSKANNRSVVVWYTQVEARKIQVRVRNPGPDTIRLATAADPADPLGKPGEPALRIAGWPLVKTIAHVEQVRAPQDRIDAQLGERVLTLDKTEWRQNPDALRPMARQLLDALSHEVPVLEDLDVVGDPRVQVGDVARLRFPDNATPVVGTVVKTNPTADEHGITGTVSVRPLPAASSLAPPGYVFFFDVSHFQYERSDPIDLNRMKTLGYAGIVAKIGQGAGTYTKSDGTVVNYGATLDPFWQTARDRGRALWPDTTAGYWYVGNVESPSDQASRCKTALGDLTIPIALDWENAGGNFDNLIAVLAAFRSAGLKVTMLYFGPGYGNANGAANVDTRTGLNVWAARYWTNNTGEPRALWDDMRTGFGYDAYCGGTPDLHQFTQYGTVYPGMTIDVDSCPGDAARLAIVMNGRNL